jgi:hypothetical protein
LVFAQVQTEEKNYFLTPLDRGKYESIDDTLGTGKRNHQRGRNGSTPNQPLAALAGGR